MNSIKFKAIDSITLDGFRPEPAYKNIPDWWKNLSPVDYINGRENVPTVKQCPPSIDALTSGYLLFTQCDMYFGEDELFQYSYPKKIVEKWNNKQTDGMHVPHGYTESVYKFINRWIIETPAEWSSMFFHPVGYPDLPFITLTGIVDTDILKTDINPPFRMKKGWTGIIKAGTQNAQIVPLKRDSWTHEIELLGEDAFNREQELIQSESYGIYLKNMRQKKEYK